MYKLSVEEVGFAMGFLGGSEIAAGFLVSLLGKLNNDNLNGRITAASHSLIARELLTLDLSGNNQSKLEPELEQLILTMMQSPNSIRCNSQNTTGERVMTVFQHENFAAAHELTSGVVSILERLDGAQGMTQKIQEFILQGMSLQEQDSDSLGEISTDNLQILRQKIASDSGDELVERLNNFVDPSVAGVLADQLKSQEVTWGTVLPIAPAEEDSAALLESNEGLLYAKTTDHLWIFNIDNSENSVATIHNASNKFLGDLLKSLIEP